MLLGRVCAPLPARTVCGSTLTTWPQGCVASVLQAPFGSLAGHRLAVEVEAAWGTPIWVRLAPHDVTVATLEQLVGSARAAAPSHRPEANARRATPVCVVEGLDRVGNSNIVTETLLNIVADHEHSLVVVVDGGVGDAPALENLPVCTPRPVSVDEVGQFLRERGVRCAPDRLQQLTGGRASVIEAVTRAAPMLGQNLTPILDGCTTGSELALAIASMVLGALPSREVTALRLACVLQYGHERFSVLAPALAPQDRPWWVPLANAWQQIDPVWQRSILATPPCGDGPDLGSVGRLAGELVDTGAEDEAIEFCLDAGWPGMAADLLARHGPTLTEGGQGAKVDRWRQGLAGHAGGHAVTPTLPGPPVRWRWPFRRQRPLHQHDAPSVDNPVASPEQRAPTPDAGPFEPYRPVPREGPVLPGLTVPVAATLPAGDREVTHVHVRLLGPMEVTIDGRTLERWHGNRGRLILAYLLLHRPDPCASELLAVTFWPDAGQKASRNRLHVAINGLRADLATLTARPIVLYRRGYTLATDVDVDVDVDQFTALTAQAHLVDTSGDRDTAVTLLQEAVALYRGHLLSDTPYEDWLFGLREHYHVAVIKALDRLAQLLFDTVRYPDCLTVCERLLSEDLCREDIHRLAMRCYARLGQPHLATRQFQACRRQLRHELGVPPEPETQDLADRLRRRELI